MGPVEKKGKRWVSRRTEWTSRDGLWTADWGLKDRKTKDCGTFIWLPMAMAGKPFSGPATRQSSCASLHRLLPLHLPSLPFPFPLPNNQDAKNEKLFATHTQIFLQFSFCYRLNSWWIMRQLGGKSCVKFHFHTEENKLFRFQISGIRKIDR